MLIGASLLSTHVVPYHLVWHWVLVRHTLKLNSRQRPRLHVKDFLVMRLGRPSKRIRRHRYPKNTLLWNQGRGSKREIRPYAFSWIRVDARYANDYFSSFKYSPLVNLMVNCTLKSIFCSIYKFTNCFLLLDCIFVRMLHLVFFFLWWRTSAT